MAQSEAEIGAHCALSSCNVNDFLPIRCRCDQLFCRDHISPDIHGCPLLSQSLPALTSSSSQLQRCAVPTCHKPSLEAYITNAQDTAGRTPALCPGCKQAFCAEHRESICHACIQTAPAIPVSQKNAAAKALLAKHFGSPSYSRSAGASSPLSDSTANPRKLAQHRQLSVMKMRHKAKPADIKDFADSVPMEQRLHVVVRQPGEDKTSERVFWFRKTVWTGKALDILASHYKLSISDTQPLKLLYIDEGTPMVLRTDRALADQIPDGASLSFSR
ncbi:hypothetical protein BD414DRAFT_512519 [Trametes punicea]|nr:hypothetical protein BD414DRAFT_512519 [Trametes punicea]